MKLYIKIIPILLIVLLTSCGVQRTSLDVYSTDNIELINEFASETNISGIFTTEDKSKTFAINKEYRDKITGVTTLSDSEPDILNLDKSTFTISEISKEGLKEYDFITCLNTESYLSNFVKDGKLYLFSYVDYRSATKPYSVFLRIWNIETKKVESEKVMLRKYLGKYGNGVKYDYDDYIDSFEPSIKVSPNKEYFVIYMNHKHERLMSVWTADVFNKEGNRIKSDIIDRKGTIDFCIDDNSDVWITSMYYDNYEFYYSVNRSYGELHQNDSYKMPKIKHSEKTNKDMLKKLDKLPDWTNKARYSEDYYPTNQMKSENGTDVMFFNYVYSNHGNGGVVVTKFDKKEGQIEYAKLIPYHEILDAVSKQENDFEATYIPEMKITNLIEHKGNYYLVLELLTAKLYAVESQIVFGGFSGDKYFVALDKNMDLKWANAQLSDHNFLMTWDNYTDQYLLQGASHFEIKDDKLSGILPAIIENDDFFKNENGYYRFNLDLETGKIIDQKLLVDINGNCKIYYNDFYPMGEDKIIIDQYNRDELYLIKEK